MNTLRAPQPAAFRAAPRQHLMYLEPNDRGGLSLRWDGDAEQIGNFASIADALRTARLNFADVIVVGPKSPAPSQ
jgi:hypothetical protein